MKHICKELGTAQLGQFQLSEPVFSQLDSGTYAGWLRSDALGKQAMREPAKALMQRHGIRGLPPVLSVQPWYRKLLTHRNGTSS